MINEAYEPSSACRLWRISQVETSTPPSIVPTSRLSLLPTGESIAESIAGGGSAVPFEVPMEGIDVKGQQPNLASQALAAACRALQDQWRERFGYAPLLTLVTLARLSGASNVAQIAGFATRLQPKQRAALALPIKKGTPASAKCPMTKSSTICSGAWTRRSWRWPSMAG